LAASPEREETGAARLADGLLEAGWLLAVLLVPAFFDVYSRHPFDPDKAMVVRLIALVMAAAGLVRAFESPTRWRWLRAPLAVPVVIYLGAAALSTALSIAPRTSLWGSYVRGEGLVTLASYVVVFAAMAARLRRPEQLARVIDAIVAGSIPVTLYGLAQAAALDPIDWRLSYQEWRVSTSLGNPVFAGSYLALVLPVTLAALLQSLAGPAVARGWWRAARLGVCVTAVGLQVAVLAMTGSRGPWMGAAAALVAFALLGAALGRHWMLAAGALAAGLAAVAFVVTLNVADGPLEPLRQTRLLGRLGHILDPQGNYNPGDSARVRVWEGALALARPRPPLPLPDVPDRRAALRPLIGYGPETLQPAFAAVYDPEFARLERRNPDVSDYGVSTFSTRVPDRSHNELLDSLVTGGVLGAFAHLLLAAAIQVLGLRGLGLLATWRQGLRLLAFGIGGAMFGVLCTAAAPSWGFLGVGLPMGLVAGWMVYVLSCAFRTGNGAAGPPPLIHVALVATLLGHFVDAQFGPVVVTGRLYSWALAGLLVAYTALSRGGGETAGVAAEEPPGPAWERRAFREALPTGLLAAALGVTLLFDFVAVDARRASPLAVWRVAAAGTGAQRTVLVLGVASVLSLVLLEASRRRGPRASFVAAALAVAGVVSLAFAVLHVATLARAGESGSVDDLAPALGGIFPRFALSLLALLALLGASLARRASPVPRGAELRAAWRAAAVMALAIAIAVPPALASVGAAIMLTFAGELQATGRSADGLQLLDRAAETAPWDPANARAQGEAYLVASRRTGSPVRRPDYLRRADAALVRARALEPLAADNHVNLARLATWRSDLGGDPAEVRRETTEAARHYATALRLMPGNTLLLDEWAELDFRHRGDYTSAEKKLQRSLRLDPTFDYTHAALGDLYMARAREAEGAPEFYRRAAAAYEEAYCRRPSLKAIVNLAVAQEGMGETREAIDTYIHALNMKPPRFTSWAYRERLAMLYLELGNRPQAGRQARWALLDVAGTEAPLLRARLKEAGLLSKEGDEEDGPVDNARTRDRH
jgi:tetratricopeptide (TPR) repeat protein